MTHAVQLWREEFSRDPATAFDRLVRGVVPLGAFAQLSLGEILSSVFDSGDAPLDLTAAAWIEQHILNVVPEGLTPRRWSAVLEEFFQAVSIMGLPRTGEVMRRQYDRLRLWLSGFYEGADRDPEAAYLAALARAQTDERFSSLWRRFILEEKQIGRSYLSIGILGFRKMPDQNGHPASDVPEGLLQALVELADLPQTPQAKWKQTVRSLFATYRRSENYWTEHLAPLLQHQQEHPNALKWLQSILPGLRNHDREGLRSNSRKIKPVAVSTSIDWAKRISKDASLCDSPQFEAFLTEHRRYAEATGDPNYISKTFNNVAQSIVRADPSRVDVAIPLIEEARSWAPWNPYNWTVSANVLWAANRKAEALDVLWKARHNFAWELVTRNQLATFLQRNGDSTTALAVLREAASQFPNEISIRYALVHLLTECKLFSEAISALSRAAKDFPETLSLRTHRAQLLNELSRPEEALEVYEQMEQEFHDDISIRNRRAQLLRDLGESEKARELYKATANDFPEDVISRSALADLLIDADDLEEAERLYREALIIDRLNPYLRGGLARVLSIKGARTQDEVLRNQALSILQELAGEGNVDAWYRLRDFDKLWQKAITDIGVTFRRDDIERVVDTEQRSEAVQNDAQVQPELDLGESVKSSTSEDRNPSSDVRPAVSHESIDDMGVAERLGRAMISLWQAERAEDSQIRDTICSTALAFLNIPEDFISEELLPAVVETRGLVLLANGKGREALNYFDEQITRYGRGAWIGIRLGERRARTVLGEPINEDEALDKLVSHDAMFALHVAKVIEVLSADPQETEVREFLKVLYPRAASLAARRSEQEKNLSIENGASMLGIFLQTRWFRPAGLNSVEDLSRPDVLQKVITNARLSKIDTLDVITNSTLSLAA